MSKIATFAAQVFTHDNFPELGLSASEWRDADALAECIRRQAETKSRRSYTAIPAPVMIFIRKCRRRRMTPTAIARALDERHIPTPHNAASWSFRSVESAMQNSVWQLLAAPGRSDAGTAVESIDAVLANERVVLDADARTALERATAVLVRV